MKNLGIKILITVLSTVLLVVLGFYFSDRFNDLVFSQFHDLNVSFQAVDMHWQYKSGLTFVFVISILPSLFLFSHFILKDQKPRVFLFIIPMTLICGLALLSFHLYSARTEMLSVPELPVFISNTYSVSNIHAARYLGIGFLMGVIISTAILSFVSRDRKS